MLPPGTTASGAAGLSLGIDTRRSVRHRDAHPAQVGLVRKEAVSGSGGAVTDSQIPSGSEQAASVGEQAQQDVLDALVVGLPVVRAGEQPRVVGEDSVLLSPVGDRALVWDEVEVGLHGTVTRGCNLRTLPLGTVCLGTVRTSRNARMSGNGVVWS